MSEDKEMHLECACHDSSHFIEFWFNSDESHEFEIMFRTYEGGIWKRIIKAIQLIFDGWVSSYPDWVCIDINKVQQLRDFCNECIEIQRKKQ